MNDPLELFPDDERPPMSPGQRWLAEQRDAANPVTSKPALAAIVADIDDDSLDARFTRYHRDNPHVYEALVTMTRDLVDAGHRRLGIAMLFEVLRWRSMLQTSGDPFKLNAAYASRYARKIMAENPDLDGVFELRELKS